MKRFDVHIHCGEAPLDSTKLLAEMEKCGIYGGVLFSHYPKEYHADGFDAEARIQQVLDICKDYPGRLFPVLWIHPQEPNALEVARAAVRRGVMGFKMICCNYYVSAPESKALLQTIAELGKPVFFHSGILWDSSESSKYNRPLHWESLLDIKGLRFSMGHCAWPWIDECIALYGKFLNAYTSGMGAEMFFDLTPGTPPIYREELLYKLYSVGYDVADNVLYGSDCSADSYQSAWVNKWTEIDSAILQRLGANEEILQKLYHDNLLRFLGVKLRDFVHTSPVPDNSRAWTMGQERPSAAPIRHARMLFEKRGLEKIYGKSFDQLLLPVLDKAYSLYSSADASRFSGDADTDLLLALLRDYLNN